MKDESDLQNLLDEIDGTGYGAYKKLKGEYDLDDYHLVVEYVQGDPYASPSRFRFDVSQNVAGFPEELFSGEPRRRALEDFLVRQLGRNIEKIAKGNRGSGKSGMIQVVDYGQAAVERTAAYVNVRKLEVRIAVGLPAKGRTPMSKKQAREMIFEELDEVVRQSLFWENLPQDEVREHVETIEDAAWIRSQLSERGLVAFVANGSRLPRKSGVRDAPMEEDVVPFSSPDSLEVEFDRPNNGPIRGMGIPEGITLIVGGGYHGKSTLLNAISHGVYDHVPGDGREYVVTVPDAVMNRAEDGRFVEHVDISPFIDNVPSGIDTSTFSTPDASGSTSQAANIMESLEVGAGLLLIDEDISATNFMIRDERMQRLVAKEKEPITPLIDNIKQLHQEHDVSIILVMGGSGDYFDVADTVIMMDGYEPVDVTKEAREISDEVDRKRKWEGAETFGPVKHRVPDPESINPRKGGSGKVKIKTHDRDTIQFGYDDIDLGSVHQITEKPQVRAIGDIVFYLAKEYFDGEDETISQSLDHLETELRESNLAEVTPYHPGNYAMPRRYEIAAALNRLRSLNVHQMTEE